MKNFSSLTASWRRGPGRYLALLAVAAPLAAQAQTGGVGIGTTAPNASAILDVSSTSKGFLPPRLSTAQRDAIASPAPGLTIFNTTTNQTNTWNGTAWAVSLSTAEQSFAGTAVTFNYTGAPQTYTVPVGVTALTVDAAGAAGTVGANSGGAGGLGARVQATLAVTPGEVLTLYVGGTGGSGGVAGYNGGGGGSFDQAQGGGGGGASDVRRSATAPSTALTERLLVAGGGGGGGANAAAFGYAGDGGGGGAPNGLNGGGGFSGQGATQTAGGNDGGTLGQGGGAGSAAGGGGGGYYGGGGGGYNSGGGGGSSWVTPTGSSALALTASYRAGNGIIVLTPSRQFTPLTLDGSNFVNVPGDNLGNHTATQNLNLGANALTGNGGSIGTVVGLGVRADGGLNIGQNTSGSNVALGYAAGSASTGVKNQFVGYAAGSGSTTGNNNVFSGYASGNANLTGGFNTFEGAFSGNGNTGGNFNTFFGATAGVYSTTGSNNTAVGYNSGPANGNGTLENATALGANITLTTSNTVVLGNGASVGIGTSAPAGGLHVLTGNGGVASGTGAILSGPPTGNPNLELRGGSTAVTPYIDFAETSSVDYTTRLRSISGVLNVEGGGSGGLLLRVNGSIQASNVTFTSDARFKTDVRPLAGALAAVLALRGVRYEWNALGIAHGGTAGAPQVGLLAQEVEKVFPELVSTDAQGYKAVNYAQLTPVLLEALKEQQRQIEALKQQAAAAQAEAGSAKAQAATATVTLETFEARLRRLEAATGGQAQK